MQCFFMRTAIILHGCAGRFKSSLGAHVRRYFFSRCGIISPNRLSMKQLSRDFPSDLRRNIRQRLVLRRHNHSTTRLVKNKFHGTVLCLIFLNDTSNRIHVWCASALIIYKEPSGTSLSQVVFHISPYTLFLKYLHQ